MDDIEDTTIAEAAPDGKPGGTHRAYLLRCWCEDLGPLPRPTWRFSIEQILPHRRKRGLQSLRALMQFLQAEFGDQRQQR